jgi:hypothetical protein
MLELMAARLVAVVVENDAAGAGGALVDRSDEFGQLLFLRGTAAIELSQR